MEVTEMARMGGYARSENMTATQRSESARTAAQARWAKAKRNPKSGKLVKSAKKK